MDRSRFAPPPLYSRPDRPPRAPCPPLRFGETISLCFWTDTFRPDSWYPKAARNKAAGVGPARGTRRWLVLRPVLCADLGALRLAESLGLAEAPPEDLQERYAVMQIVYGMLFTLC